jgi:hypothetical protein
MRAPGLNFSPLRLELAGSAMDLSVTREPSLGRLRLSVSARGGVGLALGAGGLSKAKKRLEGLVMSSHLPWIKRVIVVVLQARATVKRGR